MSSLIGRVRAGRAGQAARTEAAGRAARAFRAALAGTTALAALVATALPAAAQWFYGPPGIRLDLPPPYPYPGQGYHRFDDRFGRPLPPRAVTARLEDADYDVLGMPRFDGATYTVETRDPSGRRVTVVVDAYRGIIVGRYAPGMGAIAPPPEAAGPGPRGRAARAAPGAFPDEMPEADGRPTRRAPGSKRQAHQSAAGVNPDRTLPKPADRRLAPAPGEPKPAARPEEAGAAPRGSEPPRRAAARPEAPARNGAGARAGAASAAKAPVGRDRPGLGGQPPAGERPAAAERPAGAGPAGETLTAGRPVRVIEGVTPVLPTGKPESDARQLDNLPAPPPAIPPTGAD